MLELYHGEMTTCSQKTRLQLEEKGVLWESRLVDIRAGDQFKPEFLKINPKALVPVIVHDGRIVNESNIIGEYIDDAFDGPPLKPGDPFARARMRLLYKRLDDGLHLNVGWITFAIALRKIFLARLDTPEKREGHLGAIRNPMAQRMQRECLEKGIRAPGVADAVRAWDKAWGEFDALLADGGPWLAGKEYSLADIAFAPYVARFYNLKLEPIFAKRPNVAKWYERLAARPAYKAAFDKWAQPKMLELMAETGAEAWPTVETWLS